MIELTELEHFPVSPGVYLMRDIKSKVIYVGKAKNLKARIKQYFLKGGDQRPMIPLLRESVQSIEVQVLPSDLDAILLETRLIKEYRPKFNALFKDDKSLIKIKVSTEEKWPRVFTIRSKDCEKSSGVLFGPFVSSYAAKQTTELLNRLFPLRECSNQEFASRTRPCILHGMGRCLAPCMQLCQESDYHEWVKKCLKTLKGEAKEVLNELEAKMQQASDELKFEEAQTFLELIEGVKKVLVKQHVHIQSKDNMHAVGIFEEDGAFCLALIPFVQGEMQKVEYFFTTPSWQDADAIIEQFLSQYYHETRKPPKTLLVPESFSQKDLLEAFFTQKFQYQPKLVTPKKGEKKALLDIAHKNAEEAFRQKKEKSHSLENILCDLQERFCLSKFPKRIECFDISHIGGSSAVAAMVVYENGQKSRQDYRKYHIKTAKGGDDYGSIREVLQRRYTKAFEENNFPDLVIIDGGKGQLSVAQELFHKLNLLKLDLISLVKEKGRHDKGMSLEGVYKVGENQKFTFQARDKLLHFLQAIRDEAHRFAIEFQRQKQHKNSLKSSLWEVPGIGPKKAKRLLEVFKSPANIKQASIAELKAVQGISLQDIENLKSFL